MQNEKLDTPTYNIHIQLVNSAFSDWEEFEVASILRWLADKVVENGLVFTKLRDTNGNLVWRGQKVLDVERVQVKENL